MKFLRSVFAKKKDKGSVVDIITVCVSVLAISIVVLCYMNNMHLISIKDDVNQISRKYILKMETEGYLSEEEKTNLIYDLQSVGVTNIDLSGTTMSDAGYGNPVYLIIKGNLSEKELDYAGKDLFTFSFIDGTYPINEKRMSTAKN